MMNDRSSIPKVAKERVVATHVTGTQKYKSEFLVNRKIVGVRYFEKDGTLISETPLKDGLVHGTQYFFLNGKLNCSEHCQKGLALGTAKQWSEDGELIGTYSMRHGTG